jgi:prolyl 4-hydroxylase
MFVSNSLSIYYILIYKIIMVEEKENFITSEECDEIIKLASDGFEKSKTLGTDIEGYRVAFSTWIKNDEPISIKLKQITSEETGIPIENMETIHVVKYEVGGEYKDHQDFFHPGEPYYDDCMSRGGQRIKTALVYLNDDFTGGDTTFPKIGMRITPKKGKLVVWDNVTANGRISYDSTHIGEVITEGVKYIAVIWIREKYFWNWDDKKHTWYNTEDRWKNNEWYENLPAHLNVANR